MTTSLLVRPDKTNLQQYLHLYKVNPWVYDYAQA